MEQSNNKPASSQFLKTDGGKTKSNAIEVPSVSLPKGGGAIKGIDEKFSVNAVNGSASFSIPLPFATARGAIPALSLSYNSGSGNGIFGLGWNLSLASIKRKTDKRLPKYFDNMEPDIFLLSEVEDLVPVFEKNNGEFIIEGQGKYKLLEKRSKDKLEEQQNKDIIFTIHFYKPRIEGLFARIERWSNAETGIIKWRVITKDNITTLFGWSKNARISDPLNDSRIYQWLPEFIYDDKGNCSRHLYKIESVDGFDPAALHNRNRFKDNRLTYTNRYIDKVFYGNKTPYKKFGDDLPAADNYLFETVFDYGSLQNGDSPDKLNTWDFRSDAFSDYKSGFEIRTTRLCKRILLFHKFDGPGGYNGLVRSLNFEYDTSSQKDFTFLRSITSCGYIKKTGGTYSQKNLPATEFDYQQHEWNAEVKNISSENLVHAPSGLDQGQYQFTDLFNEGLSGILTEQAGGWYYKHNLGDGNFEQAKLVSPKPSFIGIGTRLQLTDLDADGGKQLVNFNSEPKGFFELSDENEWHPFRNFESLANINLDNANTRMLDLDGDGKAELLISEDNVFTWYDSAGRRGFTDFYRTAKPYDEEAGPNIAFAESTQIIFLADMSGDGLSDIVRIRNGEICYWPNTGYGKFGTKVLMDNAPVFDSPDSFDPAFIRLADIDGSGTTDIIYLGKNKFACWKNLSGNTLSTTPFEITAFPEIHGQAKISVIDLLGNGMACIVWSSPLTKDTNSSLRYIDLMNSRKPHIMKGYKNNMGKEVAIEYKASTHFYIEDKKKGDPWVTKLHFPVHCISRTETRDKISGYLFASEYRYHHGYYDHAEREFRGFGMVEQQDAEDLEQWKTRTGTNVLDEDDVNQAPVISKTWAHTGAFLGKEKILSQFEKEYWFKEMDRQGLPVTVDEYQLPDAKIIDENGDAIDSSQMDIQDWQEALRACKGMTLRSEIFSINDDKKTASTPYSVATHNCIIQRLQPRGQNQHAIFIVKESEAITYNYERNTADPRITHNLNIRFDEFGNVLKMASVVYPRKSVNASLPAVTQNAQRETYITYIENVFTNDIDIMFDAMKPDAYRLRLPAETKTFQLRGVIKIESYYSVEHFDDILSTARSTEAKYHETSKALAGGKAQWRLIEHIRTLYRSDDDLGVALPLYQLGSLALPFESYQLAYTPELLDHIYHDKKNDAELEALMMVGKFDHSDGDTNWWVRSGTTQYVNPGEAKADAQSRFYLPISYTDPFGAVTKVVYENHQLLVMQTTDELLNTSTITEFNYRTLSPKRIKDINDNFSEVIVDELGLVKAMALMGKGNQADDLELITEETGAAEQLAIRDFFVVADAAGICNSDILHQKANELLQHATVRFIYDFDVYGGDINKVIHKPAVVAAIARETHYRMDEFNLNPGSKLQVSFEYTNGLGKLIMKKTQAEPGTGTFPFLQWIGNGRTILNNKGNPVKQYEPFFSDSPKFENEKELVEKGVTPIMYYDALGRLIKTDMPDGSFSKIEFDPWQQKIFDANDTVTDSVWYTKRIGITNVNDPERIAAVKAAAHFNTASQLHFDTLGRPVLQIEHNRIAGIDHLYKTKIELDIEGNLRKISDPRELQENSFEGNAVMEYKYDMLGNKVYQKSMDAGQRWLMINIAGNPIRTWDERDHEFQYDYDILQRPTKKIAKNGDIPGINLNNIFDRVIYGENQMDDKANNLRGKPFLHFDTGGLVETPEYDFKGQAKLSTRKLAKDYKNVVNWTDVNIGAVALAGLLEPGSFTFITETDALGRITKQTAPDQSIITPSYNEAGLLNSETVEHVEPAATTEYIKDIDYNEKGQRTKIIYGNDITTNYAYDEKTFRLRSLLSFHTSVGHTTEKLQDLLYTYDPVGNIIRIEDKANETSFFNNMQVEPVSEYTYDALYRLTEAKGRENGSALNFATNDNWNDHPKMLAHQPGDPMAVMNYTESYTYDEVGNITEMNHLNAWKRTYEYEATNNRLKKTTVGSEIFLYPHHAEHGFITKLPHLNKMGWNFKEELVSTSQQVVNPANGSTPETTYYQYDGQGQRLRKITENYSTTISATKKDERIYIAGYETYRTYNANNKNFERGSLSLMDNGHRFVMIETVKQNDAPAPLPSEMVGVRLTRYQLHNHLGSASLEINESAEVISYEEYHPYGTTAYQAKNKTIECAAKRYRYTGMERDEETGLEYHTARYYLPWLGRWASCDPEGIIDGVNLYQYTKGCPTKYIDINGNQSLPNQTITINQNTDKEDESANTKGPYLSCSVADPDSCIFSETKPIPVGEDKPNPNVDVKLEEKDLSIGRARYTDAKQISKNLSMKPGGAPGLPDNPMPHANIEAHFYDDKGKEVPMTRRIVRYWYIKPVAGAKVENLNQWEIQGLKDIEFSPFANSSGGSPAQKNFEWDGPGTTDSPGFQDVLVDGKPFGQLQEFIAGNEKAGGAYYQIITLQDSGKIRVIDTRVLKFTASEYKEVLRMIDSGEYSKTMRDKLFFMPFVSHDSITKVPKQKNTLKK